MSSRAPASGPEKEPLLSVVIPAHNVDSLIGATLDSLRVQTPPVEVIVVDDGSTDDTLRVVAEKTSAWNGPCQVISQDNAGVSVARNVGLARARGRYILFLDGDDYVSPRLNSHFETVVKDTPDIVCWGWSVVVDGTRTAERDCVEYAPLSQGLISGLDALAAAVSTTLPIWTASMAFRRDFLRHYALSFEPGCHAAEDREFQYKALASAEVVCLVPSVLAHYVPRMGSLSTTIDVGNLDAFRSRRRAAEYVAGLMGSNARRLADDILLAAATHYVRDVRRYVDATGMPYREAMRQIELRHPGMDGEARSILRAAVRTRRPLPPSMALYGLSPTTYWALVAVGFRSPRRPTTH